PSTARSAMALLATWAAAAFDVPCLATTYRILLSGILETLSLKLPLSSDVAWANCAGAPALAAYRVTVDPTIGLLAPWTLPITSAAFGLKAARKKTTTIAQVAAKPFGNFPALTCIPQTLLRP